MLQPHPEGDPLILKSLRIQFWDHPLCLLPSVPFLSSFKNQAKGMRQGVGRQGTSQLLPRVAGWGCQAPGLVRRESTPEGGLEGERN